LTYRPGEPVVRHFDLTEPGGCVIVGTHPGPARATPPPFSRPWRCRFSRKTPWISSLFRFPGERDRQFARGHQALAVSPPPFCPGLGTCASGRHGRRRRDSLDCSGNHGRDPLPRIIWQMTARKSKLLRMLNFRTSRGMFTAAVIFPNSRIGRVDRLFLSIKRF
jgi:hypothetical protein